MLPSFKGSIIYNFQYLYVPKTDQRISTVKVFYQFSFFPLMKKGLQLTPPDSFGIFVCLFVCFKSLGTLCDTLEVIREEVNVCKGQKTLEASSQDLAG